MNTHNEIPATTNTLEKKGILNFQPFLMESHMTKNEATVTKLSHLTNYHQC